MNISPGYVIEIVGIGRLGHIAVELAKAMGRILWIVGALFPVTIDTKLFHHFNGKMEMSLIAR
jgi:hypothetical protein